MIGAVISIVQVSCTNSWICWTSLVVRVSSDGAPNRAVSSRREARDVAEDRRAQVASDAHAGARPEVHRADGADHLQRGDREHDAAELDDPSQMSPLATPSSMIAALTVGRYSDASVLISWSPATIASSERYGRVYCRSSAQSIPLLSHTAPGVVVFGRAA